MDDNIESLKRQREIHRRNLSKLKERAARYGPLNVPLDLQNEIELEEGEITRLVGKIAGLESLKQSESAEDTGPKRRVILYLRGDFSLLSSPDRKSSMIDALAGLLRIPTEAIEVYRVQEGSTIFDLGIPSTAVQRLRSLLQSNSEQLRLLKVEKVILERESGETEEWVIIEGKFDLVTTSGTASKQKDRIEPIRKLPALVRGGNRKTPLIEIAKAVGAIMGVPLALFALVNGSVAQPIIALVVALITALLISAWVVYSGWTGIMEMIVAWLTLTVVVLAGFVLWPRTMMVEGIIRDMAGNPVSSEEVVLFDRSGKRYETETNAEGHYQFIDVPTGKYKVQIGSTEVEGGTEGFLVRKVQQNITVSGILIAASPTSTSTVPSTLTPTPTLTAGPTNTPTPTPTPIATPTNTPAPTSTSTATPTNMPTITPTPTLTATLPTVVLSDFETGVEGWWFLPADGSREVATGIDLSNDASQGCCSLRCDFDFTHPHAQWPHASYQIGFEGSTRDWTSFSKLRFAAKSLVDPSFEVRVTIALATGSESCWHELVDFLPVEQQWGTLTFELDQERWRACPNFDRTERLRDKNNVIRLHILVVADGGEPTGSILIDDIRLLGQ